MVYYYSLFLGDLQALLDANAIKPKKKCINVTYDSNGFCYEIPNYCINDPSKYEINDEKKKAKKEDVEVKIRRGILENQFSISNHTTIKRLKDIVVETKLLNDETEENLIADKIRLFFGGKELNENREVWFYNIFNDSIILMMYRKE